VKTDSTTALYGDKQRNITASVGKNTLFGIIASVIQVATRLLTVPIVIAHLGLGGYGIWSIILVTATYMRFGSIGVKSAFQKYVAEATSNDNYGTTSKLLSTGTAGMLALSAAALIPAAMFSEQIAKASGVPHEFLRSTAWSIMMLAIILAFTNAGAAYEAIVMGGHRIDLTRKFGTVLTVLEAIGIVTVLRLGHGLFAMSAVIAMSEIVFVICCYIASRRVLPQISVSPANVSRSVVGELVRFAGSYQLVSVLQLIYGAIAPIAVLRAYGPNQAGVFAIASRVVSPVSMFVCAFLLPILSSSAMVFASGSVSRMKSLLIKSSKVTLAITLIPLGLVCTLGPYLVAAWTGQTDPCFRMTLWLVSLALMFQSFSLLALVLYRASGKAVMDNLREVLRILSVLPVVFFSRQLGFIGVLGGIAAAEAVGMIFMVGALAKTYPAFDLKALFHDFIKLGVSTVSIVLIAALALKIPFVHPSSARLVATIKVVIVGIAALLALYPSLHLTGAISRTELRMILDVFRKKTTANSAA